ncbi:hypothetical protein KEJ51_08415 [Candidatus Bathyarchaeota archaeon]|nr:hypothetical protein [Candidatus Bathyarchaeota archaeon]
MRANRIKVVTSTAVKNEAEKQITSAVNRLVDSAHPRRLRQVRALALAKCATRLRELWSHVDILTLHGNITHVKGFYQKLSENPHTRTRLEKIRNFKGSRSLMPEDSDLKIISEAISLKAGDNEVYFVTKDEHFCEFSREIYEEFKLRVRPVQSLIQFKRQLEELKERKSNRNGRLLLSEC